MAVLLFQFLITYLPFLQTVFHTQSLSLMEFLTVGVLSTVVFLAVEIEKAVKNR
ncbi:cation transporting ATPase C-terminal domain-containing protein [Pedobacter kyonggii]|uniref:cation transporting ATPase C-terminal domain-containing protein n=1 Tax=Pedobacter kyonggii TaxID=1926871 RepID=UPI001ABEED3D